MCHAQTLLEQLEVRLHPYLVHVGLCHTRKSLIPEVERYKWADLRAVSAQHVLPPAATRLTNRNGFAKYVSNGFAKYVTT